MEINWDTYSGQFTGKVVLITGGSGVLGSKMASALFQLGCSVYICNRNLEKGEAKAAEIEKTGGKGQIMARQVNVLERDSVQKLAEEVKKTHGRVDYLINAAGGNHPKATTSADMSFFDLAEENFESVLDVNMMGTVIPCQVIGKLMADQHAGIILNISSMAAFSPLTRVPAYSAAKAAMSNFTQWLAVHMAQEYDPAIRVNAMAPGFFLTEQNRYLLLNEGKLTQRGQQIIDHTPMARFGDPEDLIGTMLWLLSPASSFVTGIVVPIDGGFSAFSGV